MNGHLMFKRDFLKRFHLFMFERIRKRDGGTESGRASICHLKAYSSQGCQAEDRSLELHLCLPQGRQEPKCLGIISCMAGTLAGS